MMCFTLFYEHVQAQLQFPTTLSFKVWNAFPGSTVLYIGKRFAYLGLHPAPVPTLASA